MIQVILIICVSAVGWMLLRGPGSATQRAVRRMLALGFATSGTIFIILPGAVTWIANQVGVGRGTDLLLYVLFVAFAFFVVGSHQRLHLLEKRIERLTREIALKDAEPLRDASSHGPQRDHTNLGGG